MSFLQIGSWNIEHLSGRTQNAQSAYALADHIEMAGVELLVLQEIYVTHFDGDERRNSDLDRVCELLHEHLGSEWRYVLLPKRDADKESQLCAAMWNTDRISLTDMQRIAVDYGASSRFWLWDRTPYGLKFTVQVRRWRKNGNGDWESFVEPSSVAVIPLHMKANTGDLEDNALQRAIEARTLVDQLDALKDSLEEESLILIGDTNILDRNEEAARRLSDYGLRDLNYADQVTYPFHSGRPFDRVYMARNREEFKYSRQYILQPASISDHDRFLSDHYFVKASVKIYLDDADPRTGDN